jgi:hypothetical protein
VVHLLEPAEEYFPAPQIQKAVAPVAEAHPAGDVSHCDDPDLGMYLPPGQDGHTLAEPVAYLPLAH